MEKKNVFPITFHYMDLHLNIPSTYCEKATTISVYNSNTIWLAPRAGKMSQILRCDWLPERARWSYLARSGLPVARPLGIESLIPTTMRVFFGFSRCFGGKRSLKSSVNSQHLRKGKEREWNRPGAVKTLFQPQ